MSDAFDQWIDTLREDVIEDGYGYEPGEYTVYRELWRPLFDEGLSPAAAWERAMDAFVDSRRERERRQAENWARIQVEDAAAIAAYRATKT